MSSAAPPSPVDEADTPDGLRLRPRWLENLQREWAR
jgi:hypothetical protein